MDRLFAARGEADLLLGIDLVLEYRKETCSVQCHGKEGEVVYT